MVTLGFFSRENARLAVWLLLPLASCTQVLGIEDARVDPTLSGLDPSQGGSAGAGGADAGKVSPGPDAMGGAAGQVGDERASNEAQADGSTVDSGDGSPVCRQYCDDIMAFCSGNLKQYLDDVQCMKICAIFPAGVVGGSDGNTAACRMKYAGKARYAAGSERDAYCRQAGAGSDGTCGSICEGFCTLMMPTCTQTRTAPYYFPSADSCLSTCRALPDEPPFTVADGTLPDTNDAQCRLFHSMSAVMDPDEHCEHAMGVTMCDSKVDAGADH